MGRQIGRVVASFLIAALLSALRVGGIFQPSQAPPPPPDDQDSNSVGKNTGSVGSLASSEPHVMAPKGAIGADREPAGDVSVARLRTIHAKDGTSAATSLVVVHRDGHKQVVESGPDGVIEVAVTGRIGIELESRLMRLLSPQRQYSASLDVQDVYCYEVATISGQVECAEPDRLMHGPSTVSARPTDSTVDFSRLHSRRVGVGTPSWIERQAGAAGFLWSAVVANGEYSLDVPLLGETSLVASAPGHATVKIVLPPGIVPGERRTVNFRLQAGAVVSAVVVDDSGNAVADAGVQFVFQKTIPTREILYDDLHLVASSIGAGLGIREDAASGTSQFSVIKGARTRVDGFVNMSHAYTETGLILVVSHPGSIPFIRVLERPDEFTDARIVLRKNKNPAVGYRFRYKGRFASSLASVAVHECVEGLTLHTESRAAGSDGVFSGELFVPGREYFLLLMDPDGIGQRRGDVRIGSEPIVDISHFD